MTSEGYNHSMTDEVGDELTELVGSNSCNRIYADHRENFTKCEFQVLPIQSDAVTIQNKEALQTDGIITGENIQELLDVSNAVQQIRNENSGEQNNDNYDPEVLSYPNYPTQGFSINQNGYKRLDMSNCLVSQDQYSCAIPCIATIYRYRTATHSMTSASLNAQNNSCGK